MKFLFKILMIFSCLTLYSQNISQKVEKLLSQMTLEEKIGQMTQIDSSYLKDPEDITKYFIGSVLSGGNSYPNNNEGMTKAKDWADYIDKLQNYALKTRLKIPLVYGIDAVHGNQKVYGATIFPHNVGLGAANDLELSEKIAEITAKECKAIGAYWTFAPCVAVSRDERWGRAYESFSEDPIIVSKLGAAQVKGFQKVGIIACAKHYLGDGGTVFGTGMKGLIDQGDTLVKDEKDLRKLYLTPYIYAISNNVKTIMASFSSVNGLKMHANKYLLTDVLKKELKFNGFVVSDWKAIEQLPGTYEDQVRDAINAGIDMVMVPDNYINFINTLKKLVESKQVKIERINDAVRRILTVKMEMGLFEKPFSDRTLIDSVGSEEHRKIAREAVRKSIVMLKNENTLPLAKNLKEIVVVGQKADDLGSQCGGWTISWQGRKGNFIPGTTILEAIKKSVDKNTKITYDSQGNKIAKDTKKLPDAIIIVAGESPYAEFMGDRTIPTMDFSDISIIEKLKNVKAKKILVLITGRPLVIDDFKNIADAILIAWLPGTEGEGITDVIFGDYKPTGKLPFSWPESDEQLPINIGDKDYKPLFPFGFGLTY
ncbi:MAG: glycoside hydrolase family 3 C-terminal domain-containing protein [Brevinematales bacterium]|nr:glycoside hydrolase family 3 C-terminal domain-containing protein [Brevinematales bacterium]